MMKKSAFTLIELLVVIAIIAILAAILFPVFAQAKAAAKKIASVSNDHEIGMSAIMYAGDSDDVMPPATSWDTGNDPLTFGAPNSFSPWPWLTAPYIKSSQILADPQVGGIPAYNFGANNDQALTSTTWPDYGYNYVWLSPWNGSQQNPVSDTAISRPAQTVMVTAQGAASELTVGIPSVWGFAFTAAADGPILSVTVEAPGCTAAVIPQFCGGGWGSTAAGGFNKEALTAAAGNLTGGVSVRAGNVCVVEWLDGHTSAITPGQLAVGTSWKATQTSYETLLNNYDQVNLWGGNV